LFIINFRILKDFNSPKKYGYRSLSQQLAVYLLKHGIGTTTCSSKHLIDQKTNFLIAIGDLTTYK